ncbi:MAG: helix-hairpin-helix domain-containing protein, partial [bacterium]|nr:helix-hairpin-helix domain-containing protein [bacterium]
IDPVGACVGIKGVRVQSIVRELNNERIDIVPFSSNSEMFVTRALAPAKVVNIEVDDLEAKMTVAVEDEKLSLAIGRNGQNARLASKLTGWKVNIMSETEYDENKSREADLLVPIGQLDGVGPKLQERLIDADISSVQKLAACSIEALTKVEGLGEKTAETLLEKAKVLVAELEAEYEKKLKEKRLQAVAEKDEGKLKAEDVFEDDTEFVTEVDDVMEASAPSVSDDEEDFDDDSSAPSETAAEEVEEVVEVVEKDKE